MSDFEDIKQKIDGFLKKQGIDLRDGYFILNSLRNDYLDEIETEPEEEVELEGEDHEFDDFQSEGSQEEPSEEDEGDLPDDFTGEEPEEEKGVKPVKSGLKLDVKSPKVKIGK